jgi:hypothetical protein
MADEAHFVMKAPKIPGKTMLPESTSGKTILPRLRPFRLFCFFITGKVRQNYE